MYKKHDSFLVLKHKKNKKINSIIDRIIKTSKDISIVEKLKNGMLPQKWMGKKIAPIFSWGGCDVDYKWQVPTVEFWLRKHSFKNKR